LAVVQGSLGAYCIAILGGAACDRGGDDRDVLVLERRRRPGEVETRTAAPPPSGYHVRVEINGTVFEVHSSDRLTPDEVSGLVQTALAAEDRRNQEPGAGSGA
jgi:hypothetical protein